MTFTIFETRTTPFAEFRNGYLQIRGKSVPFQYPEMYDTIRERLTEYMQNPEKTTTVDFNLSAINAVSKRSIMNTFRVLQHMKNKGCNLLINWYYQPEDEDVHEMGEICKSSFNIDIRIKQVG